MRFLDELRRRNVLRVGAAYAVTAWLVIQVVETLFPVYGLSDAAVRVVVNLLGIGLIPTLVLSWVFEWTPEGLKRDAEVEPGTPHARDSARRLDRVILVVLSLALAYFAFDKFILTPEQRARELAEAREAGRSEALVDSYGDRSIAVLAFADLSPNGDQAYLSEGIAEEVLNLLAAIPELRVISRSSAFSFKDKDLPVPEIARQLGVAHVLEGSVRRAGDRIRVTAQLIDARSDTHLWSQNYDRELGDIFAIQEDLAAEMVGQLQASLIDQLPERRRIDPEAYLLYLEGHYLVSYVDAEKAALLLEQAVEIEPDFPAAWGDLSRAYYQMSTTYGQSNHEGDENYYKADQAWKRLIELDPEHPGVVAGEAWDAVDVDNDFHRAARLLEQGLRTQPRNWDVQRVAIHYSIWTRRDEVGLQLARQASRRDPLCVDCAYNLAQQALVAGHYEEAESALLRYRSLLEDPRWSGLLTLIRVRVLAGDLEGARAALGLGAAFAADAPEDFRPIADYGRLLIQIAEGDREAALPGIAEFSLTAPDWSPEVAELYAQAGRIDEAFQALNEWAQSHSRRMLAHHSRSPLLEPLHQDARWLALLEFIGVAPDQLAKIAFDPALPEDI